MRKEPENQPVTRPSLRPVLMGIAVVVLLMGAMFVADHRRHLVTEPETIQTAGEELLMAGDMAAGEILVGGNAPEPPPVRFYEVLSQGAEPTGLADAGAARREMPLPPKADPDPEPMLADAEPEPAPVVAAAPKPAPGPAPRATPSAIPEAAPPVQTVQTEPTRPAPSKPAAQPKEDRPYTLQVASFSRRAGADELSHRLSKSGYEAYVKSVDLGSRGTWYRVRVGHYPDADEARWAGLELSNEGLTPIVVHDPATDANGG
ncbi:MAG: SPOR domain-containing protein [Nitrospirota bacterium]|nr:SPOR domain-containing protein [Nitrospirota bacterium]